MSSSSSDITLSSDETCIKLIYKGKVLKHDDASLHDILCPIKSNGKRPALSKTYRIMATGVSQSETNVMNTAIQEGLQKSKALVRDDLTDDGQRRMKHRQLQGQRLLQKASQSAQRRNTAHGSSNSSKTFGFGRIETLPNLPEEAKARKILTSLANDPGVKACLAKHGWNVGVLAEMYPKGQVGVTDVCVMGLNTNRGAKIELRLRTDDLKGFRKMLSIREVLYHELAHNEISEHNGKFFQLMRQIKKECLELDWTHGKGTSSVELETDAGVVEGGTYILGRVDDNAATCHLAPRELARRAAIRRLASADAGGMSTQCFECDDGGKSTHGDFQHDDNMDESP
ncbi:MAG: hypothetical protein SGARI_004608 [Bacillariaceae sp.]